MKYYVYLLMDNFSRFILNFRVSEKVSGKIRLETIKQAFEEYIKIPGEDVRLIEFSNSIVEAQNKIIKYRYLFKHDFKNIHELRNLLSWTISDYNYKRPHCSLNGLTPYEALAGKNLPKEQWHRQILDARMERLIQNTRERCEIC